MATAPVKLDKGSRTLPAWVYNLRKYRGLFVPIGFVSLLIVIIVPLPPWLLDLLISANISLAVVVLLTTIYMVKPLDFSVFPSLLLATTLFRLVLNIASTRLILSADVTSVDQPENVAGKVIAAFGDFVAGDSLFVGVVIFLIIVIVQFMVITKGAGRISEVAARFTLDAMPGKQMAIDSDLNAGIIEEGEARARREEIRQEADFFGAMDGASKFVRGDAIASIIITAINIIGGFAVGILSLKLSAAESAELFTKLTIGDGLTSQIPSFVISIAAALIVTRSGSRIQFGDELTDQLVSKPEGLYITAGFLGLISLTPLPTLPLMGTAIGLTALAYGMNKAQKAKRDAEVDQAESDQAETQSQGQPIENLLKVDTLELEVGFGLVGLVDTTQGGDLLDRISAIRRQLAQEFGFVMPPVRIRDNMQLGPSDYRINVRGNAVATATVEPNKLLAMDSGLSTGAIEGEPTKEPAFGLDAWWIERDVRARAEALNYTVVDPTSVLATHLTEVVKQHAHELLTRQEVSNLVEGLKERAKALVEDTIPSVVKIADLQKVLQNLLRERVPIRDMETIVETLSDWAPKTSDPEILTEYVRNALRRTICRQHAVTDAQGVARLVCVTLDPTFEDMINGYIDRGSGGTLLTMPARIASSTVAQITEAIEKITASGNLPVVIASPQVRAVVRQLLEPHLPHAAVLGYNEIEPDIEVESMALVMAPEPVQEPQAVGGAA